MQDEIAHGVVSALKVKLLPGVKPRTMELPTTNMEAYEQYLLGKQLHYRGTPDSNRRAVESWQKAIALDPSFGLAYAWLAFGLKDLATEATTTDAVIDLQRRSLASAEKAAALAPESAEAFSTRGLLRWWLAGDRAGAQADLDRALRLNPNDASSHRRLGFLIASLGQVTEGIAEVRKGIELDPIAPFIWARIAKLYVVNGQPQLARQAVAHVREIAPWYHEAEEALVVLDELEGNPAAALALCPNFDVEATRLWCAALAENDLGHSARSQEALDQLVRKYAPVEPNSIAEVHAWRGENDRAIEWLERSFLRRGEDSMNIKIDPLLRKIRSDPRYTALLKKTNLPLD